MQLFFNISSKKKFFTVQILEWLTRNFFILCVSFYSWNKDIRGYDHAKECSTENYLNIFNATQGQYLPVYTRLGYSLYQKKVIPVQQETRDDINVRTSKSRKKYCILKVLWLKWKV